MLLRLSVTNFLSIDTPVEFSMLSSKETQHGGRLAVAEGLAGRILQTAAIWGGNASGKSNFCKVLQYAQWMVSHGTKPDASTSRRPFKLRKAAAREPSRFEFDILVESESEGDKEKAFRYTFAVTGREVVEESLVELRPASIRPYFSRKVVEGGGEPAWTLDWWERKNISEDERLFAKFVARGTKGNQLFLHEAMDRNLELLAPVFRWFRDQLVVVEPEDNFLTMDTEEPERGELREFAASLLRAAGTGIDEIEALQVPAAAIGMPTEVREKVLDAIKSDNEGVILRSPDHGRFSVFRKDGELLTSRLVTYRTTTEGLRVQFELSEESDGTRRVFDLSPLFLDLEDSGCRKVYVIDEFDRSLHGEMSRRLLEHYFDGRNKSTRAQLIFTAHDLFLMDQSLLRRDEMWFVDRSPDGATKLNCLSEHKSLRYDKDVRKAYLEGQFGGMPRIIDFPKRPKRKVNEDSVGQPKLPGFEV
ncbi:MAG: ATP-binding protein [Verrucomicrobiae bacterium]|nr:ATP-binding protein [Verrucomicrobiae bacterium]